MKSIKYMYLLFDVTGIIIRTEKVKSTFEEHIRSDMHEKIFTLRKLVKGIENGCEGDRA